MKNLILKMNNFKKTICLVLFAGLSQSSHALVAGGGPWKGQGAWRSEYMYNITYFLDQGTHFVVKAENGGAGGLAWLNKSDNDQCGNKLYKAYYERVYHCNTSIAVNVYGFGAHHSGAYEADMYHCGLYNDSNVNYCEVKGCTDSNAINYNSSANTNDGSCYYTQTATSNPTGNNCRITITSCPNHREYEKTLFDTYNGAKNSKEACLQRARDYSGAWCGNSDSNPITADYLSGSAVLGSLTVPTQTSATSSSSTSSVSSGSTVIEDEDEVDETEEFDNRINYITNY